VAELAVAELLLVEVATLAAYLDLLVQLVLLVNLVVPVNPVLQVFPETQENHQFNLANPSLHHHANHAHKDLPAHLDLLVLLVMLVLLDNPVPPELMLHLANPDQKVHLVLLVNLVPLVLLVNPVHPHNLNLLLPDPLDPLEMLDHLAHPDLLVPPETMVLLDNLDQKVPLAQMDNLVPMVNLVLLDKLVLPVVLEKRVSAPNIVLSMVVSSSKMELVVKNFIIDKGDDTFKWLFAVFCLVQTSQFVVYNWFPVFSIPKK